MNDKIERIIADINSLTAFEKARLMTRLNGKQRTHMSHSSAVKKVTEHLNEHGYITAPQAFKEGYLAKKLSSSEFERCVLKHIDIELMDKKVKKVKHYYTSDCTAEHLFDKPPFKSISSGMIHYLVERLDKTQTSLAIDNILENDKTTYPCYLKKDNRLTIRDALVPKMREHGYRLVKGMTFTKEVKA